MEVARDDGGRGGDIGIVLESSLASMMKNNSPVLLNSAVMIQINMKQFTHLLTIRVKYCA